KMYSWGDDTATWKNAGAYDYGDAKRGYFEELKKEASIKGSRTYSKKKGPNLELVDPKGKNLATESENPIIVMVDGTGSMQTWPAEIFDRLPLFYQTLSKYKDGIEVSFSVIGDANIDQAPCQITPFGKGTTLDDYLKGLHPEGGGGPGIRESYELWAHFVNEHVKTPKATSPFMIIMGDEKFYDQISPEQAKHYLGDTIQAPIDAKTVWKSLAQKFDIYLLRKEYAGHDDEIKAQWAEAIGPQKIIPVYEPTRVVDVAMGIIAKRWGKFGDFKTNLSARQDDGGIAKVMDSLRSAPGINPTMKSAMKDKSAGKKSKELTEGEA
ncbi:hypothetical protein HY485_05085, partial [Candidatus Woesearchaeota archaeon]|nr:hypothetical protein [Candidatus Woesearchaeota archaeon]